MATVTENRHIITIFNCDKKGANKCSFQCTKRVNIDAQIYITNSAWQTISR